MELTTVPTFTATIYVGLKHRPTGEILDREIAVKAIQQYTNSVGLCVTVTDTQYIYTNGGEPGLIVGLINYPRFPAEPKAIKAHAMALAEILLATCRQFKVSVVMPGETVMLSSGESCE